MAEKLADLIEANPNCHFEIDNDVWYIVKDTDSETRDNELAKSDNFSYNTDWYGHSSNYGFALAEAMVILLNRKGFNITASAV